MQSHAPQEHRSYLRTPDGFTVRTAGRTELKACVELYRRVFEIAPREEAVTPRLLSALGGHSGLVIGAYRDEEPGDPVGFAYSFLSRDERTGTLYQYSQVAVVEPELQGRGLGQALKMGQRRACLAMGIGLLRWAFDPLRARNARFNTDVLGGVVRTFVPDFYGDAAAGRDRGLATDRLIVDWDLMDERVLARAAGGRARPAAVRAEGLEPGRVRITYGAAAEPDPAAGPAAAAPVRPATACLPVPADWARWRELNGPERARALQQRVAASFTGLLDSGWEAFSCPRATDGLAVYVFRRRSP
ncbi:hypothetical protein [Peterkaempfera sp. SMS 1(5)a]|uniref:hypothetical protein n=1 Tax=Peterkaempfera podocarpi TaxID=3232308 RepID=UPI00366D1593